MNNHITFGHWEALGHLSDAQTKRIERAQKAETTPISINKAEFTGTFPGSGGNLYSTSLDSCTCADFSTRHLPCKHIYRLAIECGVFPGTVETGLNKNNQLSLETAVSIIENFTEETQEIIDDVLFESLTQNKKTFLLLSVDAEPLLSCPIFVEIDVPVHTLLQAFKRNQIVSVLDEHGFNGFKRNSSQTNLISWCIENISDIWTVFPHITALQISEDALDVRRSLHSYFVRKFHWEFNYDENMVRICYPAGSKWCNLNLYFFPDDKVTRLLTQYGHNRCLNGFSPQPSPEQTVKHHKPKFSSI